MDFWERKRQELQAEGKLPMARPEPVTASDGPWWAQGTNLVQGRPVDPQKLPQFRRERSEHTCPNCGSEDFMKPNAATAARCFACGHVEGRQLNEPNLAMGISVPANSLKVKQLPYKGTFGRTVEEINRNNAILEQSAQGKVAIA